MSRIIFQLFILKIVKTLGLSKLIYNTSVLVIPEHYAKEINNLAFNFIWEGKPAKIKKNTIISDIKLGGLKILDFEIIDKALKIAWIKRLTEHDDAAWRIIPEFATTDYDGLSFLIQCQYVKLNISLLTIYHPFITSYLSIGKNITMANFQKTLISQT